MAADFRHLTNEDASRIQRLVDTVAGDAKLDRLNVQTVDAIASTVDMMLDSYLETKDADIAVLSRERASFLADRDAFAAERDALKRENDALRRERDLAEKERSAAVEARDKSWRDKMEMELYMAGEIAKVSTVLGRKGVVGNYSETLTDAAVRMSNVHFEAATALRDQLLDLSGALGYGRTDPPEFEALLVDAKNLRTRLAGKNSASEHLKAANEAIKASNEAIKVANDRIALLDAAFVEVGRYLTMGMPEDPEVKSAAIINILSLNYVRKDTIVNGRDRCFDCRACGQTCRWSHEHQTLGYVQRLCSACFPKHGVLPTDQTLKDGTYAKSVEAATGSLSRAAKEAESLRADLTYAQGARNAAEFKAGSLESELKAVKDALGECWMEGNGRTVAGAVGSVRAALGRANAIIERANVEIERPKIALARAKAEAEQAKAEAEQAKAEAEQAKAEAEQATASKNEAATEYLLILGDVQSALGDHWSKARLGVSTAEVVKGLRKKADDAEPLFAEYRDAFDRILAALDVKTEYPTIADKAKTCVSIIETFIRGYRMMDGTNKARCKLFEKAAKIFEQLAADWKDASSAQVANTVARAP